MLSPDETTISQYTFSEDMVQNSEKTVEILLSASRKRIPSNLKDPLKLKKEEDKKPEVHEKIITRPEEPKKTVVVPQDPLAEAEKLNINGIIISDKTNLALINGTVVAEGTKISDFDILKIENNRVLLGKDVNTKWIYINIDAVRHIKR